MLLPIPLRKPPVYFVPNPHIAEEIDIRNPDLNLPRSSPPPPLHPRLLAMSRDTAQHPKYEHDPPLHSTRPYEQSSWRARTGKECRSGDVDGRREGQEYGREIRYVDVDVDVASQDQVQARSTEGLIY